MTDRRTDVFSHAFCENCQEIQPCEIEERDDGVCDGNFAQGVVVCSECDEDIATLYKEKDKSF